jgi:hypothetical protein
MRERISSQSELQSKNDQTNINQRCVKRKNKKKQITNDIIL